MHETEEGEHVLTGQDLLGYYADRGYTVDDLSIDHTVPGDRPKRTEVTVELTLKEPVSSVLDRMERGMDDTDHTEE